MTNVSARSDMTMMVAGQGGDGSLTLINLLGDLFAQRGFHLYQSRNVASRIKGGHAAAFLRASMVQRGGLGDSLDLLVAFDQEAIDRAAGRLAENGFVIYDSSDGPADSSAIPPGATLVEIPIRSTGRTRPASRPLQEQPRIWRCMPTAQHWRRRS